MKDIGPIQESLSLGLDLGVASIGWGLLELDPTTSGTGRVVACGSLCFEKAETPESESLAAERLGHRSTRRRRLHRKH